MSKPATAPLSRTLPVLALYNAALKLGLFQVGKRRRPAGDPKQMELPG
jgi:hypothetical protein